MDLVWLQMLRHVIDHGRSVRPRGQGTVEVLHHTVVVDMRRPVLRVPERKLSYTFMAAEAYWILSGDDRVETIAPYNSRIADFSDDGKRFFGAYGPKVVAQLSYVVAKLTSDLDTRQAGLTIWRESPPETKDVPCTVAIFFSLRQTALNAHVFMRSSDIWLGLPYDVFNFSMLAHAVCGMLPTKPMPGLLYLTAASSHLYLRNYQAALECKTSLTQPVTPAKMYQDPEYLMCLLKDLRDSSGDDSRWWEQPCD